MSGAYRDAGVDTEAAAKAVALIADLASATRTPEVADQVGGFAGLQGYWLRCRLTDHKGYFYKDSPEIQRVFRVESRGATQPVRHAVTVRDETMGRARRLTSSTPCRSPRRNTACTCAASAVKCDSVVSAPGPTRSIASSRV